MKKILQAGTAGDTEYLQSLPYVVGFKKGWQKRKSIPTDIKNGVLSVGKCAFCGSIENLTIDHIIPVSKGGSDELENLQCLCFKCNRKKGPEKNG